MVSYYKNIKKPIRSNLFEPNYVLEKFANPTNKQKDLVDVIRETSDEEEIKRLKKKIPVVTWNGEFIRRRNEGFINPSGYMYIDIDQSGVRKSQLVKIPHLSAAWKSVSGRGYGCLMRVEDLNKANFGNTFEVVAKEFSKHNIKVDRLTDIARANFISYDEDLLFRDVEPMRPAQSTDALNNYNVQNVLKKIELYDMCSTAIGYTKKKFSFVPGERDNFTFLYFIQCNEFGVDLDYAYWFANEHLCTSSHTWNKAVSIYRRYSHKHGAKQFIK